MVKSLTLTFLECDVQASVSSELLECVLNAYNHEFEKVPRRNYTISKYVSDFI